MVKQARENLTQTLAKRVQASLTSDSEYYAWREAMVISFSLLNLSLAAVSQTQVGKIASEINSVMPPQILPLSQIYQNICKRG